MPEVRLARVEVVAPPVEAEAPVLVRAGGVVVEVRRGCAREALAAVLDVLEVRQR